MDKPTDSEIIDRLGGTTEVARICQIKPPSVSEWRTTGIPPARRQYLELLRPDVFGLAGGRSRQAIGALVDTRMSKRALRARLGLSSDAHLAKVLGLSTQEVEGWAEEGTIPQLPQVLGLLGAPEEPDCSDQDTDSGRVINVEVA